MKNLFFAIIFIAAAVLVGCQEKGGLKVGYVNCCVTQADGSKICKEMPQGQCSNIVSKCEDCK